MKNFTRFLLFIALTVLSLNSLVAQNPIIRDQFSADPSARVFNGKVYLYPSHDIPAPKEFARKDWFCMQDYHVFSSSNLTDCTDNGVIVSQNKVNWVDSTSFSMWAPDYIARNGKYYFYFPPNARGSSGRGFGIGVAVADNPTGPYTPQPEPIRNVRGIDPCPFIDKDGQAYIYYSMGNIFVAKLKENMLELSSVPQVVCDLPREGLKVGNKKPKSVQIKALSQTESILQILLDKADGILLAEVKIHKGTDWNTVDTRLSDYQKGIHNLIVVLKDINPVEVDWIRFVK